jgi:C1A family cysteine protease
MTKPQSPTIDTSQDATFNREKAVDNGRHMVRSADSPDSTRLLNWAKDRVDNRDYLFSASQLGIQPKVDLRPFCTPVEDQGNIGSCTGCAITSAVEILLRKKGRNLELSRLFVYYQERLLEGTIRIDAGAYLRSGIKATYTWGAPRESLWAYNTRLFAVKPPQLAYTEALGRKITRYERCNTFDSVKQALSEGYPVVAGFMVYQSFLSAATTRTGVMPYPRPTERQLGGHAVCLVGYDEARKVFIAKNSWGIRWGDRGYFYMPYQVIQNTMMSSDLWVIKDVMG